MVCATPRIQNGDTPLLWASKSGHRDCVEVLLNHKADPEYQDEVTRGRGLGGGAYGGRRRTLALWAFKVTVLVLRYGFWIWISAALMYRL